MPVNIPAIVTDYGREALLDLGWGQGALPAITQFKVGEGGWEDTPGGRVPRDPSDVGPASTRGPVLTDLDVLENSGDYPAGSQSFAKALNPGDLSVVSSGGTTTLTITCTLLMGEFNGPPFPEIYEVGIFDASGDMVLYGTCPRVEKNPGVSRTFLVKVAASRS